MLAAGVNLVSRWLLDQVMSYSAAIFLAYLCGMATAFVLAKYLVFERSALDTSQELLRFALVNVAGVIQVWAVSIGLAEWLFPRIGMTWHAHDLAHMAGVAVPVLSSYFGHKYFSFRRA
jgi:putative flippase GtrA